MTKIEMIKQHRTLTGSGLAEAKAAVEAGWTPEKHQHVEDPNLTELRNQKDHEIADLTARLETMNHLDDINQETIDSLMRMIENLDKKFFISVILSFIVGTLMGIALTSSFYAAQSVGVG